MWLTRRLLIFRATRTQRTQGEENQKQQRQSQKGQALPVEQIHNNAQHHADHNTAHYREVKTSAVFAFDDDVTGQVA